jgi:GNAT superfamily N-acetyltransferase
MSAVASLDFIPASVDHAAAVHDLYTRCPAYIDLIGGGMPTLTDITRELETLTPDPRRQALLLLQDNQVVGFLDYKLAYPDLHSATISLLLIDEALQNQGLGQQAIAQLEGLIKGRVETLYAAVYGNNHKARMFWQHRGFSHIRDGGPTVSWYRKDF